MGILIILALLWIVWLVSSRRWRRRLKVPIAGFIVLLVLISPIGIGMGSWILTAFVPPDSGEPVEAIVVLGRGKDYRNLRVFEAWELWQAKRAPRIFASGMLDARPMVRTLRGIGVPEENLAGEECSQTTQENALFTASILRSQGVDKILLVTDPPHMLRSLLTFRSFRFRVIPHFSALPNQLSSQNQIMILLREYAGLVKYTFTGQFIPRSLDSLNSPPDEVTQKLQKWRCQVRG
jgi:uncharacterized SAM-binding protein YcdF (DUF218 family)